MRRLLLLCNSEVKSTFEQIFEVGAAGAENHLVDIFIYFIYIYLYILFIYMFMFIFKNHLVGSQRLPSGRQRHVHKVLIFQKAFEGICQRSLKKGFFLKTGQFFKLSIGRDLRGTTFLVGSKSLFLLAAENALANIPDNYSTSGRIGRTSWISLSTFFLLLEKRKILLIFSPLPNSWEKGTYRR